MGVWQVTNDTQPYVGQWDATTDTFWDGLGWVGYYSYLARNPTEFGMGSPAKEGQVVPNSQGWPFKTSKKEAQPKTQDPWEALKSMF